MIFIPYKDSLTHLPVGFIENSNIAKGNEVLIKMILDLVNFK